MESIGYFVGDFVDLASDHPDRETSWFERILFVVLFLGVLLYAGSQIYASVESYRHPDWSSTITVADKLLYPSALFCPLLRNGQVSVAGSSCRFYAAAGVNSSLIDCGVQQRIPTMGRWKGKECVLANAVYSQNLSAVYGEQSTLELTINVGETDDSNPIAVILFIPSNWQMLEPTDIIDTSDSPNFVVAEATLYWATITVTQYQFYNSTSGTLFQASVSSTSSAKLAEKGKTKVNLIYETFAITRYYQIIGYDWLSVLGTVGGAMSLVSSIFSVLIALHDCMCKSYYEEKIDGDINDDKVNSNTIHRLDTLGGAGDLARRTSSLLQGDSD